MATNRQHPSIQASAGLCFGRDTLCEQIIRSAFRSRSVLLFGGRQAGKTTVLLRVAQNLAQQTADVATLGELDVAVYVNLLSLPDDAVPADFFRHLARLSRNACERQITGFTPCELPSETRRSGASLDRFISDLETILSAAGEVRVRLLFLLDESKRVIGDRFPRGFQDNLFTLLYGDDSGFGERMALVFAGAQDLYRFCEDDTSPIGSRAAFHFIDNLAAEFVAPLLIVAGVPEGTPALAELAGHVFKLTGGHAGLTARLAECLGEHGVAAGEHLDTVVADVRHRHAQLMRLWTAALSSEARFAQPLLRSHGSLSLRELARTLHEKGLDPIRADRVGEELSFTGVARQDADRLIRVNAMYWDYFSAFSAEEDGSQQERDVWGLIEQVEVSYRGLVLRKYEGQWPGNAIQQIQRILGSDGWQKVNRFQESASKAYPYSPGKPAREVMECLYLGQLGTLMTCNQSWALFKHLFRDKRHIEDLMAAINPVRNDQAHFVKVPPKELARCRIACDDMLVIYDREEQAGT